MSRSPEHARSWNVCRGETRAIGALLPGAVAPVGELFAGSCHVLALRAGRVSTVSVVHDASAGLLSAWKTLRTNDTRLLGQFRRHCERWAATDPPIGAADVHALRVWNGRTYLTQELLPSPMLADALRDEDEELGRVVIGATELCRTVQDFVSAGFTDPAMLHPANVRADGLANLWLTDPTTSSFGRCRRAPDVLAACGALLTRLFGCDPCPPAAARERWADAPTDARDPLHRILTRCAPDARARFACVGDVADALEGVLRNAHVLPASQERTFPIHTPRFTSEYQTSVHHGYQLLNFGCFELAEGAFRRALALAPWSLDARLGLAETTLQTDHVEEAMALAGGAVSEGAEDSRAWQVYARALVATHEEGSAALPAAERAVQLAPKDPGALLTLAQVVEMQGDEARSDILRRQAMDLAPHWAEPALSAAFLALDRGDNATAVSIFTQALRANPLETEAWQGRALALEYQGRYALAARSVEYLAALQPESEEFRAWGRRLRLFGERPDVATTRSARAAQQALDHVPPVASGLTPETRQDLVTALGAMDHALHLRPDAVALWCLKGELQSALEDLPAAAACYTRAVELDAESGAAWLGVARARLAEGDEAAGMDAIMRAMSVRRPMPAAGLLGAELHWRQGRRGPALRLLEFTLAMAPAWAPAWQRMAEWAERMHHPRMALRAGRALSELVGQHTAGLLIMARNMVRLGMLEDARTVCEDALAAENNGADTWAILAEVQQATGDLPAARHSWERSLECDPDRADLWCAYAQTLLAAGDTRSAAAVVQRATRLAPDVPGVWRVSGEVHLRAGQTWLARQAFGRALKFDPTDAVSWYGLGDGLLAAGRTRAAVVAGERAATYGPDLAKHWCLLGRAQLAGGETQPAARSFDRAISLAPEFVPAWHMLAVTEVVLGRYNAAGRSWQRVLALAPNHPAAREGLQRLQRLRHRGMRGAAASESVLAGLPGAPALPPGDTPDRGATTKL